MFGERFPRRCRLRKRKEFQHTFAHGKKFFGSHLRLVVCRNSLGYSRLGLAVSRRIGNAVGRNRVKRRIRELFRRNRDHFPDSCDIVVIPQVTAAGLSFDELQQVFLDLAKKAGRLGG